MAINVSKIKKLPDTPGVYFFLGKNKKILYIGKATSLRSRVRSYLAKDIDIVRSPLIAQMTTIASAIDFKVTDSVLEALILEADLIRKFKPEFNTKEKDDKSFYCVVITDEEFPITKLVRKKDLESTKEKHKAVYGPYPEGLSIKEGLKVIRKIFPYRDEKCVLGKRCFNYQIGLCPGTCINNITKREYACTIRNIKLFFEGKKGKLLRLLQKEMKGAIKGERFEDAGRRRNQIYALEHIRDVSLIKRESAPTNGSSVFRIEAYDIAHMSGKDMVGVMTVMDNGELDRAEYRKFIIRDFISSNDTGALQETLRRRFNHPEWPFPNLIVIDGGQAQLNAAQKVLDEKSLNIHLVSIVKDERHKARELLGNAEMIAKYRNDIIKLNAEAHRYAIAFHKNRRSKSFLPKF